MGKEQMKKWMRIFIYAILGFLVVYITCVLLNTPGLVSDFFIKPFVCIIPLCLIAVAGILHIVYMFVEKGEPLRIIGNVFVGLLVVYFSLLFSNVGSAEHNNRDRYNNLENLETQIVNNLFDDSIVNVDYDGNPFHYSIFKTMIYESEYNRYDIESNEKITCSVDVYCADNYTLAYNKILGYLEEKLDVAKTIYDYEKVLSENEETGTISDIQYNWSCVETKSNKRYITRLAILVTYDDSVYLININFASNEKITVDMYEQTQKLIEAIRADKIFVK